MGVVVRKNQILGIAIKIIDKTFLLPKDKLHAQFNIILSHFVNAVPVSQSICRYYAKSTF